MELITGRTYNAESIRKQLGHKNQGGIRYSGNWPRIRNVSIILSEGQTEDSIYPDRISNGIVEYVGEGQSGDQVRSKRPRLKKRASLSTRAYLYSFPVMS